MLLGRCCEAAELTFRVMNVSTILGPVMVISAPADIDAQADPGIEKFYVSECHTQGARYHRGPSDEAYLKPRSQNNDVKS